MPLNASDMPKVQFAMRTAPYVDPRTWTHGAVRRRRTYDVRRTYGMLRCNATVPVVPIDNNNEKVTRMKKVK